MIYQKSIFLFKTFHDGWNEDNRPSKPIEEFEYTSEYKEIITEITKIKDKHSFIEFILFLPSFIQKCNAELLIKIFESTIVVEKSKDIKIKEYIKNLITKYKITVEEFDAIVEHFTGFGSLRTILKRTGLLTNWLSRTEETDLLITEWVSLVWEKYCLTESQSKFAFAIQVKTKFPINTTNLIKRIASIKSEKRQNRTLIEQTQNKIWNNLFSNKIRFDDEKVKESDLNRQIAPIEVGEDSFEILEWPKEATNQTDILNMVREGKLIIKKFTIVINSQTNQICFLFPHSLIDGQTASELVNKILNDETLYSEEEKPLSSSISVEDSSIEKQTSKVFNVNIPIQNLKHNQITAIIKGILEDIPAFKENDVTFQVAQTSIAGRLEPTLANSDAQIVRALTILTQCGIPVGMSPLLFNSLGLTPVLSTQKVQALATWGIGVNRSLDAIPTRPKTKPSIVISSLGDTSSNNSNYIIEFKSTAGNTDTKLFIGYLYNEKSGELRITLERDRSLVPNENWMQVLAALKNPDNWQ